MVAARCTPIKVGKTRRKVNGLFVFDTDCWATAELTTLTRTRRRWKERKKPHKVMFDTRVAPRNTPIANTVTADTELGIAWYMGRKQDRHLELATCQRGTCQRERMK